MLKKARELSRIFFNRIKPVSFIPDKIIILFDYLLYFGKFPDLKNPTTFDEKIQWLKLYGDLEDLHKFVDKYEVRSYVEKTVGADHLVPLHGIFDNPEKIDFNELPDRYVLKMSHGSGYNIIIENNINADHKAIVEQLNEWMGENYYNKSRERQYLHCKPKILCEKYLKDDSGGLLDYKFFCYNGVPRFVGVDYDRFSNHQRNYYDMNWNKLPVEIDYQNFVHNMEKPQCFDAMKRIAGDLSKEFLFVRVDMYLVDNEIIFSELTFTPANGLQRFVPYDYEYEFGKYFDYSMYENFKRSKLENSRA